MEGRNRKGASPTIYDIAKAAGVSPVTVSRALNNMGYVHADTRQRIEAVMRELQYSPNRAARSLKSKRTGLLLLAIPDIRNPFYVDMINAVQIASNRRDYSMILFYTEGQEAGERKALHMLQQNYADGLILVDFHFSAERRRTIDQSAGPVVLCALHAADFGEQADNRFDSVCVDTRRGIREAVTHLIGQGCARVAYVGGQQALEVFRERFAGYCDALRDAGRFVNGDHVLWNDYTEQSGYEAGMRLLTRPERPDAVCAANDLLAMGVMRAAAELGLRMPEDLMVTGMDDIDAAVRATPSLCTVAIAQAQLGAEAAERVFARLQGDLAGAGTRHVLEPRLIVRGSAIREGGGQVHA